MTKAEATIEETIMAPAAETPPTESPDDAPGDDAGGGGTVWNRLLSAETGPGELADYATHPLNITGDRGGQRLARALTGWFGNLRLALADAILAAVDLWRDHRPGQGGTSAP